MLDSDRKLRHLAFFDEIASLEENSDAWKSATAGLVTLRLVDSWLESGESHAGDDEWNFKSVCAAVDKVSERSPMQALLTSVLVAIREGKPNIRATIPALMAYAKALEWDAKMKLAADVYQMLLAHLHPTEDSEACVAAHLRLGVCCRSADDFDGALAAYSSAFEIANAAGDLEGVLRARVGEADIAMLRGNLPVAASQFDALIDSASSSGLRDVHARALMGRAGVAILAEQFELAIRLGYEALKHQDSPTERDRILSNIAAGFLSLGVYSAARDAYLVLSVTAREQYTRWTATLNLLELSARTGSEILFEQYHRQLAGESLPAQLQAGYHLTAGSGFQRFGHIETAYFHLERAIALSRHVGLGQYVIMGEAALASLNQPVAGDQHQNRKTPAGLTAEVRMVAEAMKELRELTGVG